MLSSPPRFNIFLSRGREKEYTPPSPPPPNRVSESALVSYRVYQKIPNVYDVTREGYTSSVIYATSKASPSPLHFVEPARFRRASLRSTRRLKRGRWGALRGALPLARLRRVKSGY
jgi:hypothetical protein